MPDLNPTLKCTGYVHLPPPDAPILMVDSIGPGSVGLEWTPVLGATSYGIYIGTSPGGEALSPLIMVTGTTTTITGLANGTYYFLVRGFSTGSGFGQPSNEVAATVQPSTVTDINMFDAAISGPTYTVSVPATGVYQRLWINGQEFPNTSFSLIGTTLSLMGTIPTDFAGLLLQLDYV